MKKTFLILIVILSSSIYSSAQTNFGIKGGLNFANLAVDKDQIDDTTMKLGFTAGIFMQKEFLGLEWLMLQPELLYTLKGAKYKFGDTDVKANLQYLDIPVSVVARIFNSSLSVHAGAQFGFLTKVEYEYDSPLFGDDTIVDDDKDNYNKWDLGFHAGLGFNLNNLLIEARIVRGVRNVEEDRTILSTDFSGNDSKNFSFQLTAGLLF